MEQAKQQLTSLITRINNSFPEGNDLKGFLGISKALITDTLVESDGLLVHLKEYDNRFEAIILKRELAEIFEKLNRDIDEEFEKISASKFNSILKQITKLRYLIRETYIALANGEPIRTEAEIIKSNEELKLLKSNIEELKQINIDLHTLKDSTLLDIEETQKQINTLKNTTVDNINSIANEIKTTNDSAKLIFTDLGLMQETGTKNEEKITEFLEKIETQNKTIEIIKANTIEWEKEINSAKGEIIANTVKYGELNSKSTNLLQEIEETHAKIFGKKDEEGNPVRGYLQETEDLKNRIAFFLGEQHTKFLAQFTEIESLLPGATSAGLAEAYQIQKASYKKPLRLWSIIFITTISIMTILSIILLYIQFYGQHTSTTAPSLTDALITLLKDLPFFIPTIWLAGYASKQQSQYKRLQEEYAFKETNAKSFHGHKMQIEELMKEGTADKDLLMQLVAQLVVITAQNPSDTLDSKSHEDSPPIFKLVEKMLPPFKRNKEGLNEVPPTK